MQCVERTEKLKHATFEQIRDGSGGWVVSHVVHNILKVLV